MNEIIAQNFSWMTYNVILAILPVLLGWMFYYSKSKSLLAIFFVIWLLFVPNTIYLFTDIIHFIKTVKYTNDLTLLFFVTWQYTILVTIGLITFILAVFPVEKKLRRIINKKANITHQMILINFLIGAGITFGRIYRLNSWDVLFAFQKVIDSLMHLLSSPPFLAFTFLLGLFANFLYFLFRKPVYSQLNGHRNEHRKK